MSVSHSSLIFSSFASFCVAYFSLCVLSYSLNATHSLSRFSSTQLEINVLFLGLKFFSSQVCVCNLIIIIIIIMRENHSGLTRV